MEPYYVARLFRRGSAQAGRACQDRNGSHTHSDSISNPDVVTDTQRLNPCAPTSVIRKMRRFQRYGAVVLGTFGSRIPAPPPPCDPPPPPAMHLSPSCRSGVQTQLPCEHFPEAAGMRERQEQPREAGRGEASPGDVGSSRPELLKTKDIPGETFQSY